MTTAQEILRMIETVDPTDTAKLDEIDNAVWKFLHPVFRQEAPRRYIQNSQDHGAFLGAFEAVAILENQYTRSRDALKAIRPDEWYFRMEEITSREPSFMCFLAKFVLPDDFDNVQSPHLKSEELAELYAIIKAIEYERTHEKQV